MGCFVKKFEVPSGSIRCIEDGRGNFEFCGPGLHQILDPVTRIVGGNHSIASGTIVHGDRTLVVVDQGFIGFAMDRGQPVLLPPGLHQWKSDTLRFQSNIDLNSHVIRLGPFTLLTVDEGYCAVTQNNGAQIILAGGKVHFLTHRNWKFEKFVSQKIQTDVLDRIEATSADNVLMQVNATVAWRIDDVETAARMSAETMRPDGGDIRSGEDIVKLRNDVLKQAEASLSSFIGTVNYSSTFSVSAEVQQGGGPSSNGSSMAVAHAAPAAPNGKQSSAATAEVQNCLFDAERLESAVEHANRLTNTYGVHIISINIITARPVDRDLMNSLAKGAVAAAEAQQLETTAHGRAKAMLIEANGFAESEVVKARGMAEAEKLRADGAKQAADLLSSNPVAVELAKIGKTGEALGHKGNSSFFFGSDPQALGSILANPNIVRTPGR
jgi:regulator of protease activity HflC (stomatin/prohibitin superfamily)